jgi:hypothetical protein
MSAQHYNSSKFIFTSTSNNLPSHLEVLQESKQVRETLSSCAVEYYWKVWSAHLTYLCLYNKKCVRNSCAMKVVPNNDMRILVLLEEGVTCAY